MADFTFKKIIVTLIFIWFNIFCFAQKNESSNNFSDDFSIFLTEMEDFMNQSKNDELKHTFKIFRKNSNTYTSDEKEIIVNISNKMRKKRLKPKPYFNSFFNSFSFVSTHSRGEILKSEWLEVIVLMLENTSY